MSNSVVSIVAKSVLNTCVSPEIVNESRWTNYLAKLLCTHLGGNLHIIVYLRLTSYLAKLLCTHLGGNLHIIVYLRLTNYLAKLLCTHLGGNLHIIVYLRLTNYLAKLVYTFRRKSSHYCLSPSDKLFGQTSVHI